MRGTATAGAIVLAAAILIPASPAMADSIRNDQWYLKSLRISDAHAISKGSGETVAVIDTGSFAHTDLRQNLLEGVSFVSGESSDGRTDRSGHGTNMAALVAAHGRGNDGILGIAPGAKVLPVKISNSADKAPPKEMAKGIEWALAKNARIINVSAGIGPSFDLQDAVARAMGADAVVVASIGNAGQDAIVGYPAAIEGVLAVGSVGPDGKHSALSVNTPKVQICAPGVEITTAEPKNKYVNVGGTSPAAAIASGAAALVRSRYPKLSAEEVIHRLTATADDIGPPGRDDECGFGRLNIVKALTADVPPLEGETSAPSAATTAPVTVGPTASAAGAVVEEAEPASASRGLLYAGVAAVVVVAAALVFFVGRRRRGAR
ncbi:S8 family serine peptidase [Actinoplanes sp. NPDC049596]|uniref:S8 family serine peptidase n=1 Tax=unclassified Actinoplanes TaxID=2626549 RepID=UPI00343B48B5